MKTSTAFKLRLIKQAIAEGIRPTISLRGWDEAYKIVDVSNHGHSLVSTLDRGGGVVVYEPDDIQVVWLPKLPTKANLDSDDE